MLEMNGDNGRINHVYTMNLFVSSLKNVTKVVTSFPHFLQLWFIFFHSKIYE
jgi:hypothetical protein